MNFAFSEEQEELRRAVRQFLESKSPETEVRRLMETTEGFDPAVWKQMGQELMLQGLAIPEEYGGQGFTFIELGIVLEEMGRVLAVRAVLLVGRARGRRDPRGRHRRREAGAAARHRVGRHHRRAGVHRAVGQVGRGRHHDGGNEGRDGLHALGREDVRDRRVTSPTTIVVVARTAGTTGTDGISFFTVAGDADGLTRTAAPDDGHDPQAGEARVRQRRRDAARRAGGGLAAFSKVLDQAAVALSNEMMGGAQKVLEMSVEYAKVRVQFGRPIGSFQAIKHKCADMLLEVESGKSAAYYASWAAAEDNDELPVVAALAKAYCSEAYFHAAAENIQIHGGIGFTWEHPAHLYFKRAKSSEIYLGDPTYHRELLAQRIGI